MNWLWWTITGLSGVTLLAAIAAAVLAPAALLAAWQAIAPLLLKVFRSRIGLAAIVGIAAFYGASWYQHRLDAAAFAREKAAFIAAQAKRDADIAKDTEDYVRRQIADEYIAQQETQHEVDGFKQALDPAGKCRIGDDAPRLRIIAGTGQSGRADHKGMQQAARKAAGARH